MSRSVVINGAVIHYQTVLATNSRRLSSREQLWSLQILIIPWFLLSHDTRIAPIRDDDQFWSSGKSFKDRPLLDLKPVYFGKPFALSLLNRSLSLLLGPSTLTSSGLGIFHFLSLKTVQFQEGFQIGTLGYDSCSELIFLFRVTMRSIDENFIITVE